MLVVVIIGVLASVIVPRLVGRSKEAKVVAAKSEINGSFATALELYETHNGNCPTTEQGLEALIRKPTTPPAPDNWQGPYLKKKKLTDPWGNEYQYTSPGIHNKDYDLKSFGPDGVEGGGDDITSWED